MVLPRLPMILSSFNDISPPSVTEWRGFITTWYGFFWMPGEALRADPVQRPLGQPQQRRQRHRHGGDVERIPEAAHEAAPVEGALLHTFLSRREQGR